MMSRLCSFVVCILLCTDTSKAVAFTCGSFATPEEKFRTATRIFSGKVAAVVSVERAGANNQGVFPPLDMALHAIFFQIDEIWKGPEKRSETIIHANSSISNLKYRVGDTWVIYATQRKMGQDRPLIYQTLAQPGETLLTGDGECGYGSWPLEGNWLSPTWNKELADLSNRPSKIFVPEKGFVDK